MHHRIVAPLLLLGVGSLAVSACAGERSAPVVLTVARGTEPFWLANVRTDRVLFSRAGADSAVYPYAPPDFDADGRAVYRTRRFGVDPLLTLVIQRGDCSDGMSDQRYPGRAVLTRGDSTWRGCATIVPDPVEAK
ncbi:COG3650 family protein [Gemmatimonas sp.]|uniref:COG3650 family protein n=1 Tax=Gemmatimonas sp. TaxID=1962908 RepID=UPI003982EA68